MEPFKNLLGKEAILEIAQTIKRQHASFNESRFVKSTLPAIGELGLKARAEWIATQLIEHLPKDPDLLFEILCQSLKLPSSKKQGLEGMKVWPLTIVVARMGRAHFGAAMKALHQMTQAFTSEFAVRTFFLEQESETLAQFKIWLKDPSEHVRRLVSEGSRPLLPWGLKLEKFYKNPHLTWELLEELKTDGSKYVQKSVANHINDLTKAHPEWVLERLEAWKEKNAPDSSSLDWIIKHGTRTLVKQGHPRALKLHGVTGGTLRVSRTKVTTSKIKLGQDLKAQLVVENKSQKKVLVIVDWRIELKGAGSGASKRAKRYKVFKGSKFYLSSGESRDVFLKLKLKPVTTRKYYPGLHKCEALVNGQSYPLGVFTLRL